jgi:hypothetical protein
MRKIPTVLRRNPDDMKHVLPEVTPGCEWVLAGEGTPTRKYDGTCVFKGPLGDWFARREVKPGKQPPADFTPLETDENTGKTVGWEPIEQSGFYKWFRDALEVNPGPYEPGGYELCGPKVQGNPEGFETHVLVPHEHAMTLRSILDLDTPHQLMSFARWAGEEGYEGIVWHHPDGRMAKLKARDVPMDRPTASAPQHAPGDSRKGALS